jgi:hypothetical protein
LFLSLGSYCQFGEDTVVALINGPRALETYQQGLKADFSLDTRRTLFQKNWIAVGGLKGGVVYNRIHRAGIGLYFLNSRIFDRDFSFDIEAEQVEYEFGYATFYYDRVLFFNRKWETGATFHLGGGDVDVYYQDPKNPNERIALEPIGFSVAELSVYGEYNFFYWLALGAGIGYRQIFNVNSDLRKEFSSPIFVLNLQVKIFKLARSLFDESVKYEY